jgi:hypothetical protein
MTAYEWDYETVNSDGDIEDHNHADKLRQFNDSNITDTLVLVRDSGSEASGLDYRLWAYVKDGKLPEYFSDSRGITGYKVPKRFHIELKRYLNNCPVS